MSLRLQEAEPIALGGLDHVLQAAVRKGVLADEADFLHAGLLAFVDFEHEIDAIVRQFDDLRLDPHVEAAVAVIDFDDALHVGLHGRPRQRAARLRLHFGLELLVLGLLVAFEGDAIDDRVFDHGDDQPAAGVFDPHVLEQAGGEERLQALVFLLGGEPARAGLEIGADGLGFDPAVASHLDGIGGLRGRNARGHHARDPSTDRDTPEDDATKRQSPQNPHTKSHAQRALLIPRTAPAAESTVLRARFCQLCTAFYPHCKRTSPPSFPFPSKSCRPATITRWPSAECH